MMKQLIAAVQYLHRHNIVHRDIKLHNLFVTKHKNLKLGDFGFAIKVENAMTCQLDFICGTPNYLAPEMLIDPHVYSYQVDIWCIGIVLYALLFGKPPFETASCKETYRRIRRGRFYFPRERARGMDFVKKWIIRRILVRDPKERPSLQYLFNFFSFERTLAQQKQQYTTKELFLQYDNDMQMSKPNKRSRRSL
jgi:serine/threonine protein kinase